MYVKIPTVLKSFIYYNRIFARILRKDEIKKLQLFMREHSDYMIKAKYRFDLLGGKSSFVICYDNLSNSRFMRFKYYLLNFLYPKISILKTREITKGIKVMLLHDKESFKIFDETNNYVYCFFSKEHKNKYIIATKLFLQEYLPVISIKEDKIVERLIVLKTHNNGLVIRLETLLNTYIKARRDYSVINLVRIGDLVGPSKTLKKYPDFDSLFKTLQYKTLQKIIPITCVHGDFSLSNFLIDDKSEYGFIIDYEDIHINAYFVDLFLPVIRLLQSENIDLLTIKEIYFSSSYDNIIDQLKSNFNDQSNLTKGQKLIVTYLCLLKSRNELKGQVGITNGVQIADRIKQLLENENTLNPF